MSSGMSNGPVRARGLWAIAIPLAWTIALFVTSCQKSDDLLQPGDVPIEYMTASFLPDSIASDNTATNRIELDGEMLESEWGGALDDHLPFFQIRMTRDNGVGDPGETRFVSAKAVFSERDIYLLFRWNDATEDVRKDGLFYVGPDNYVGCTDGLTNPSNWSFEDPSPLGTSQLEEDRFSVAFEIEPTGDAAGAFEEQGCLVACHSGQTPQFGAPGYGRLDVWQWMATRTNVVRNLYDDNETADFPARGTPGYLEDYVSDPVTGLSFDPGTPAWRQNFIDGIPVPLFIYRPGDDPYAINEDPNCENAFGEECRNNNGLELYYLWRDNANDNYVPFSVCDTMNFAPLPQGTEARKWEFGDMVTGYYYTYPSGSRADLRGKAALDAGIWTLEIARQLNTGDPSNDVIFDGVENSEIRFSVAMFDNSSDTHWGSGPLVLRFGSSDTQSGEGRGE